MKGNLLYILAFAALASAFTPTGNASLKPRISGLETDSLYMAMLAEEDRLKSTEDSLSSLIDSKRKRLAIDTTNIRKTGAEILALENGLFSVRNKLGIISSRTNIIEQEFLLANIAAGKPQEQGTAVSGKRNLIDNDFFKDNLSAEDYASLKKYTAGQKECVHIAEKYGNNYLAMEEIAEAYDSVNTQHESDSLLSLFRTYSDEITALEEEMSEKWGTIVSEKNYIYALLLDKLGKLDELNKINISYAEDKIPDDELKNDIMSAVFAEFPYQWQLLMDYELLLANTLGLREAVDSISGVKDSLIVNWYEVNKVAITPKEFVKYSGVSIVSPSPYTAKNPIPEIEVPKKGKLYTVTVGAFASKPAVSTFRGAVPTYYQRQQGIYRYFVGLYRTFGEAYEESLRMKSEVGFRKPEVAVWNNGEYENIAAEAEKNKGSFYVEIKGLGGKIPANVQYEIGRYAHKQDVTLIGNVYFIGVFSNRLHAGELAEALNTMHGISAEITEAGKTE